MSLYLDTLRDKTITDATAGNGGDVINFSKHFNRVQAYEFKPDNYQTTLHNVNTYGLSNVTVTEGSYGKFVKDETSDIVYMDPPWGGPDYRKMTETELTNYINNDSMGDRHYVQDDSSKLFVKFRSGALG